MHRDAVGVLLDPPHRALPAHLAATVRDAPLELAKRRRGAHDTGIRRVQNRVLEPHSWPAPGGLGALEQLRRNAALAQHPLDLDETDARRAAERGAGPVRDEAVQAQDRLALYGAKRIPALAGAGEQIEIVLLRIGVVEVAGLAVRGALRVPACEPLEHDRALAAPGQRPARRQPHRSAAHHDDPHVAHPSILVPSRLGTR